MKSEPSPFPVFVWIIAGIAIALICVSTLGLALRLAAGILRIICE